MPTPFQGLIDRIVRVPRDPTVQGANHRRIVEADKLTIDYLSYLQAIVDRQSW